MICYDFSVFYQGGIRVEFRARWGYTNLGLDYCTGSSDMTIWRFD